MRKVKNLGWIPILLAVLLALPTSSATSMPFAEERLENLSKEEAVCLVTLLILVELKGIERIIEVCADRHLKYDEKQELIKDIKNLNVVFNKWRVYLERNYDLEMEGIVNNQLLQMAAIEEMKAFEGISEKSSVSEEALEEIVGKGWMARKLSGMEMVGLIFVTGMIFVIIIRFLN